MLFLNEKKITQSFVDRDGSHWVGTKDYGVFYFPNTNYSTKNTPEIFFEFIGLNNKRFDDPKQEVEISPNFTTLSIGYVALLYPEHGRINYQYKIDGIHEEWISTQEKKIQFTSLPDRGEYIFWVKAQGIDGQWGDAKNLRLVFITPYYKTWWFIVGSIVTFLLVFWLIIRSYYKKRIRIKEMESEMQALEGKALQSQMNPHFVFNSLNSIQSFIATGDTMKSEIYLAKFSDLLRKTLQNSRSNRVSLSNEIENIETYLDLEKMRFEERLNYEFHIDPAIEQDLIEIPPMIIQPFVENAIVHGLSPKKEGGTVHIKITEQGNDAILCYIEDNGVGRNKSVKSGHISLGTNIVSKRLTLLKGENKGMINYTDLKDEGGQPLGTIVKLTIPV